MIDDIDDSVLWWRIPGVEIAMRSSVSRQTCPAN